MSRPYSLTELTRLFYRLPYHRVTLAQLHPFWQQFPAPLFHRYRLLLTLKPLPPPYKRLKERLRGQLTPLPKQVTTLLSPLLLTLLYSSALELYDPILPQLYEALSSF